MIILALSPMEITAPKIEYGLLAPVLVIFAGACVGVLAERLLLGRSAELCSLSSPSCRWPSRS
jgi:hypothetical protein